MLIYYTIMFYLFIYYFHSKAILICNQVRIKNDNSIRSYIVDSPSRSYLASLYEYIQKYLRVFILFIQANSYTETDVLKTGWTQIDNSKSSHENMFPFKAVRTHTDLSQYISTDRVPSLRSRLPERMFIGDATKINQSIDRMLKELTPILSSPSTLLTQ